MKTFNTQIIYFVLSQDFCLCSCDDDPNYGSWHVYKPLFGSSVSTGWLACSKISLSIDKKKPERSPGKSGHSTIWQMV